VAITVGEERKSTAEGPGNLTLWVSGAGLRKRILVCMESFTLHVDNQGRLMLPAWWRRKEGINSSTDLCVAITEEGSLVVETRDQGLRRARALLRKYIPESADLSGELITDRRAEAKREA
jgi:bifunctional DNA-binding transcriptional regulator/antitoxin component of YhaV-PrlF toxin-antitoxin module